MSAARITRYAAALLAFSAPLAQAGGPLSVCNPGTGNAPLVYQAPSIINLNYEGAASGSTVVMAGNGGSPTARTKTQADALVTTAVSVWTNVSTATVVLGRGADLPVDVTTGNYTTYLGNGTAQDGLNPVVYDVDGSLTDLMLGAGQKSHVLGFAGSAYFLAPTCRYAEGQAVLNGFLNTGDETFKTVIAHEIGHLIGLDHSQLDSTQGLTTANYPLMYPIAYRTTASLSDDEVAAVSKLYPDATYNSTYGTISGALLNAATPVRGANLWAREVNTLKVYSTVSDYLKAGTGAFSLNLPAGTYTLTAEAVDTQFTGGSGIGPYSASSSGLSFQPPLYPSPGVPMAPVALGHSSPILFHMAAGCAATVTFNLNAGFTDSVLGNCGGTVNAKHGDFNGDGRSDIVYRNNVTGQVYRFLVNSFVLSGGAMVYTEPNIAWKIAGTADFNGDGIDDLLYRNDVTGQVFMLFFNSSGLPNGGGLIYTEPNLAWKIIHTPDIDGDGKADLLWWNSSTGQVYAMIMNGLSITAANLVYAEPNTAWKIAATGDFAGSGKTNQLLYRNSSTGQVFLMTVNYSAGTFSQTGQLIYQEANTAWKIVAAADFNGDGKTDILWRNDATGQVYMMLMNGPTISGAALIYQEANLAWKIIAQGDYNGDGKADILWRNDSTGQVYMMLMNGLSITSAALVYTEGNIAWRVLGPWEYGLATGILP